MQAVQPNAFVTHASSLNLGTPSPELKSLIRDNLRAISQNALTTGHLSFDKLNEVTPLSLNPKTFRFVPKSTGAQSPFIPSAIARIFDWETLNDNATTIKDFFDFSLSLLQNCAI